MHGLMMDVPLQISSLIRHADRFHGDTEIVSRLVEGGMHRYTYSAAHQRSRQLANALTSLGVRASDRIGTLAWNGFRHFEIYYAVSGMGAVSPSSSGPRSGSSERPAFRTTTGLIRAAARSAERNRRGLTVWHTAPMPDTA